MNHLKLLKAALLTLFALPAIAQMTHVTSGSIKSFEKFPSKFVDARTLDVWLPDGYNVKKKYAVLYMQDGQMLFDSTINWNHQEWAVDETMEKLISEGKIRNCIVVGIWNSRVRHSDYFPQKPFESLSRAEQDTIFNAARNKLGSTDKQPVFSKKIIQSDNYLKFLVQEVKPFIDSSFSTLTDRANTFISGSSMGGLISMYAICEYPGVFGGAACLSTHWPGIFRVENNPVPAAFFNYLKNKLPSPKTHKFYFDYGSETLDSLYKPYQIEVDKIMVAKGYSTKNWITREFPGDEHSEKAWRKRFYMPATFLLKK
ncbi:MAG: alpha/beta hydrolase [Bacteroidales bacterium]